MSDFDQFEGMKPEAVFQLIWSRAIREGSANFEAGKEKYGDSWEDTNPEYLWRRFEEERLEFRQEVEHYQCAEDAIGEMGDFMNFAVMYLTRVIFEEYYY